MNTVLSRRFPLCLATLIAGTHTYAFFAFGATFWVDISCYIQLGEALKSNAAYQFYSTVLLPPWRDNHFGLGVPLFWVGLSHLPPLWQWPVMAVLQHLAAGLALYFVFRETHRVWPTPLVLLPCALLCLLPFYQSFHNMLMTESPVSSLFLVALGAAVRLLAGREGWNRRYFGLLLAAIFLATQFRVYFVLPATFLGGLALLRHRRLFSRAAVGLGLTAAAAFLFLPVYRYARTGLFMLHSQKMDTLVYVLDASSLRGPDVERKLTALGPLPPAMTASNVLASGIWYEEIVQIAEYWREQGVPGDEMVRRAQSMAAIFRKDSRFWVNSVLYGLNSCGLTLVYGLLPPTYEVKRGTTAKLWLYHGIGRHRWESWTYQPSYRADFDFLVRRNVDPRDPGATQWALFVRAWDPWLIDRPVAWRDPLRLGRLFADVWFVMGIAAGLWLLVRRPWLGLLALGPVGLNWAIMAAIPFGDARYAYAFVAPYFLAAAMVLGEIARTRTILPWRRNPRRLPLACGSHRPLRR